MSNIIITFAEFIITLAVLSAGIAVLGSIVMVVLFIIHNVTGRNNGW